jgi:hypothetical protein
MQSLIEANEFINKYSNYRYEILLFSPFINNAMSDECRLRGFCRQKRSKRTGSLPLIHLLLRLIIFASFSETAKVKALVERQECVEFAAVL